MRAARWLGLGLLLWLCRPAEPWYRPPAGPPQYSVGRASGLLSGLRRPPHTRRSHTDGTVPLSDPPARLHAAALCVTDVAPELRSCWELPGAPSALRCKADVTVSLDPVECAAA
ncbi:PREDICTED: neuropeptide B [Calidris pugnax]|uniref:neuropeptide B n=1 Tax=Calidris pugnax TaxID=198806 RepID=UPI00071CC202|nr:PREDICTED: neuropeptide B [Calidris pugnax]